MNQYRFRQSFAVDPRLSDRLFKLLEIAFPGVKDAAVRIRKLGAPWEDASTPFIRFHDELAITHVGVLEIPMRLMGKDVVVGGIHGVCTHPQFRRRGYYREVMEEVLNYCDRRYQTLVLTTSQPELYKPFGFRWIEEHIFISKCDSKGGIDGFRLLNTSDHDDIKLLHRLLEARQPVSNILGIVNEKAIFCYQEGNNPLYYAQDLDLIAAMKIEGNKIKLFDVVGTQICTLEAILKRVPQPINEVEIYFCPERLDADVQALPHLLDGDSFLMVRGAFPLETEKFMLPHAARC
ncbi:GNAT family N-acetyltransferase [Chlorogloeopsis sp. ULAP01]|uniref:GNAT family N-acetyltransferase n=1 Tax=Chlorogloeopsis sp. ULAP01 TaxID=3056483 RepID=UPI0025AAB58D|nr:GNAT family N-acetyltransferase [Chlorogloeopsis sp. ULAP01]MDM9381229.1 GNAT family N-acetyltransferase [Chlorogloeopsis sp. ULAP01]